MSTHALHLQRPRRHRPDPRRPRPRLDVQRPPDVRRRIDPRPGRRQRGTASFMPQDAEQDPRRQRLRQLQPARRRIDFVGLADASVAATTAPYTLQNGIDHRRRRHVAGRLHGRLAGGPDGGRRRRQRPLRRQHALARRHRLRRRRHHHRRRRRRRPATARSNSPASPSAAAASSPGPASTPPPWTASSLSTNVTSLTAQTFGLTGNIVITEANAINLTDVETFGGSVTVTAGGDINVSYVAALDSSVSLQVTGANGSILDLDNDAGRRRRSRLRHHARRQGHGHDRHVGQRRSNSAPTASASSTPSAARPIIRTFTWPSRRATSAS